jgi:hypothetical protein
MLCVSLALRLGEWLMSADPVSMLAAIAARGQLKFLKFLPRLETGG